MKKGLTFILTFILSFICITSYVNAEDGLSCTFLYDTTNENSDKSSITLPINFYGDNYLGNFKMTVKGKQQSNIIINKDVNGNWYVSVDGNKSLVDENASGNYVWTGNGNLSYKKGFAITKEDWESLKSAIENGTKDIYVTAKDNKFLITASPVSGGDAASIKVSTNYSVSGDNNYAWNNGKPSTSIGACVNYLGSASTENTPAYYLNKAFFIMKIVSILGVILFSMLDFASQITANKDNLIPTAKKCGKRIIMVILLLLLPTFIDMIGNIIGQQDILCGIK